jgi:alpha-L-fucosidase 2
LKENSPYQIDGNLGGPCGFIEMLLQSHGETPLALPDDMSQYTAQRGGPVIRLLPALPKAWPNGTFRGLRARGGVEIDLHWEQGKAFEATLRSSVSTVHTLALSSSQHIESVTRNGKRIEGTTSADGRLQLHAEPGTVHILRFA